MTLPASSARGPACKYCQSYAAMFEEAPVAYHELDRDGVIQRVNQAECALLGYTAAEMTGRPIWDFMVNAEEQASRQAIARKLAGTETLRPFLRRFETRDGRQLTLELHDRLIRNAAGEPVGIRTTLIDVTARVESDERAEESRRWLTTILRSLGEAVIAVDSLGYVKFWNPLAEQLTGWREEEAIGRDIDEVALVRCEGASAAAAAPSLGQLLARCLATPVTLNAGLRCRDSRITPVQARSSPIVNPAGHVVGVVVTLRPAPAAAL